MEKINVKKLDDFAALQLEISDKIKKLEAIQTTFSPQERAVGGGWAFLTHCPWNTTDLMMLGGDGLSIQMILQRAFDFIVQRVRGENPAPTRITPPDRKGGGNGALN